MKIMADSEYIGSLQKILHIDKDGNATFGKDLGADGTIGGNSGLKVLHHYTTSDRKYAIDVYFETYNDSWSHYHFIGNFIDGETKSLCIGEYQLSNGFIDYLACTYYGGETNPPLTMSYSNGGIDYKNKALVNVDTLTATINNMSLQNKLYRHNIQLENDAGEPIRFEYISPSMSQVTTKDDLGDLIGNNDVYIDSKLVLSKSSDRYVVSGTTNIYIVNIVKDNVTPL